MADSSAEQRTLWDEVAKSYRPEDAVETPDLTPTLDFLAELVGDGRALEFGVGAGRIAVPLFRRGVRVDGLDVSPAMVDVLHQAVAADELPASVGSMATADAPHRDYQLVYIVYNALSLLLYQDEQIDCFQNAARHLKPGGYLVNELWIPQLRRLPPGQTLVPGNVTDTLLVLDSYDLVHQRVVSRHYELYGGRVVGGGGAGSTHRYVWPAELDVMATMAGLEFMRRFADWDMAEFTADSKSAISVWQKPS